MNISRALVGILLVGCGSTVSSDDDDGGGGSGGSAVSAAECISELEPKFTSDDPEPACVLLRASDRACGRTDADCVVVEVDCQCLADFEDCGGELDRSCYGQCFPFTGPECAD